MNVIDLINSTKSTAFSFEVLPPLKGTGIDALFRTIEQLKEFDPKYVNITTHRSEYVYKDAGKVASCHVACSDITYWLLNLLSCDGVKDSNHSVNATFSKHGTDALVVLIHLLCRQKLFLLAIVTFQYFHSLCGKRDAHGLRPFAHGLVWKILQYVTDYIVFGKRKQVSDSTTHH